MSSGSLPPVFETPSSPSVEVRPIWVVDRRKPIYVRSAPWVLRRLLEARDKVRIPPVRGSRDEDRQTFALGRIPPTLQLEYVQAPLKLFKGGFRGQVKREICLHRHRGNKK